MLGKIHTMKILQESPLAFSALRLTVLNTVISDATHLSHLHVKGSPRIIYSNCYWGERSKHNQRLMAARLREAVPALAPNMAKVEHIAWWSRLSTDGFHTIRKGSETLFFFAVRASNQIWGFTAECTTSLAMALRLRSMTGLLWCSSLSVCVFSWAPLVLPFFPSCLPLRTFAVGNGSWALLDCNTITSVFVNFDTWFSFVLACFNLSLSESQIATDGNQCKWLSAMAWCTQVHSAIHRRNRAGSWDSFRLIIVVCAFSALHRWGLLAGLWLVQALCEDAQARGLQIYSGPCTGNICSSQSETACREVGSGKHRWGCWGWLWLQPWQQRALRPGGPHHNRL